MSDLTIGPIDKSGSQIIFHNTPGGITNVLAPPSAGKPVTITGTMNAPQVHGTVNNGSTNNAQIVIDNPA